MQQNNNLALEIAAIVFACLLAIIGAVLLYIGKIDFNGALAIWGIASGVFGLNMAYKAPSPSQQAQIGQQQAQIGQQQQSLQQVISQFVGIIPGLVQVFQQAQQPAPQPQPIIVQPPVVQAPTEAVQAQQTPTTPPPMPAPQSVIPQRPQFVPSPVSVLPAVNLGAMNDVPASANMATLTATPNLTMNTDVQRNWNDSALIPVVQPTK